MISTAYFSRLLSSIIPAQCHPDLIKVLFQYFYYPTTTLHAHINHVSYSLRIVLTVSRNRSDRE